MTAIDLTDLEIIADLTFNDFKAAHIVGNSVAVAYYTELAAQGTAVGIINITNYANLAKDVAGNSGISGVYANNFSEVVADEHSVDFTVGSDNWLQMQYDLMQADLTARVSNIGTSGTGEIDYNDIIAIHTTALDNVGLPPETFSLYTPLSQIAESDPARAQEVFASILPGTGLIDLALDGGSLAFGVTVSSHQHLADILRDYNDQADWLSHALSAAEQFLIIYQEDPGPVQDLFDKLEALANLAESGFGTVANWAGYLHDLADTYSGGFNIPSTFFGKLPGWTSDAKTEWGYAQSAISPLVFDLDGDGVELTTFNASTTATFFDLDNDGFAEQTAWLTADQDSLLARDINENGIIDNVGELFGSPNVDGFAILAQLDTNNDLKIDASDDAWDELVIWKDVDGDAKTDAGELYTLASLDINGVNLAGVAASNSAINGNLISHTSTYTLENGTTRAVDDVWFIADNANSFYTGDYTLDVRTLFLPTLRGFGEIPDLHIAMSQNETLLGLVQEFAAGFSFEDFSDPATMDADITDILYTWAGVDGIDPDSRGSYVDAQRLAFLESFFGQEFWVQTPLPVGGSFVEETWLMAFAAMKAQLLLQAGAGELFGTTATYDPWAGEITGNLNFDEDAVAALAALAPSPGSENEAYWTSIASFIDTVKGVDNLTGTEEGWLNDAVQATDNTLTWGDVLELLVIPEAMINGTPGNDTLTGTDAYNLIYGQDGNDTVNAGGGNDLVYGGSGADVIHGEDRNDTLYGEANNDTLHGGNGNDILDGGSGDDVLNGGAGGNFIYGGEGDDMYVYSGGDDFINELGSDGTDIVTLPSGIDEGDLTFYRVPTGSSSSTTDLLITIAGGGSIQIHAQLSASSAYHIETLVFYDTSTIDLTTLVVTDILGTLGNDNITGTSSADTIDGKKGNDTIYSGDSSDTINGGDGNDYLAGQDGDDIYVASAGFDAIADGHANSGDSILIPDGFDEGDLTFFRNSNDQYDLQILITGLGQVEVQGQFHFANTGIEGIVFANSDPSIDMADVVVMTIGTSGNDYTLGGISLGASGNNILDGRGGNDTLFSYTGDDVYVASQGSDTISDTGGDDVILFKDNTVLSDITFYRTSLYNLVISHTNGDQITVLNQFNYAGSGNRIEAIEFQDDDPFDLTTIQVVTPGTEGNDTIGGITNWSNLDDIIYGYGGNDSLQGGDGDDMVYGGDDNDYVYGLADNDTLYGDDGDDTVEGGGGNDVLHGGSGDDTLDGGTGADTVDYSDAADSVTVNLSTGTAGDDGDGGSDTISNVENVTGSDYADTIAGSASANVLSGGAGNDKLAGAGGNDTIDGGAGTDTVNYSAAAAAVTVSLASGTASDDGDGGADAISNVEDVIGSAYNDTITGSTGDNTLAGRAGNDTVDGGSGIDTVDYSAAAAAVTVNLESGTASNDGDGGNDTLSNLENVIGSAYNDTITGSSDSNALAGRAGSDTIDGGSGTDTVDYSAAAGSVTVSLTSGTASNDGDGGADTLSNIENVTGSANADTITGSSAANVLSGGAGNDTISGSGGVDTLMGGAGNDSLDGGTGADIVSYAAAAAGITLSLASGTASNDGDGGSDTLTGLEDVIGSAFNDTITGSSAQNEIYGGGGNDTIDGGSGGVDILYGEGGNDTITGNSANSWLYGGDGDDVLYGGDGSDNLYGEAGDDLMYGGAGNDDIFGHDGSDELHGGDGNDTLNGGGDSDTLYGDAGDDDITGGQDNDLIYGGADDDDIDASAGHDFIYGGDGLDTMDGGNGNEYDVFVFESASAFNDVDVITSWYSTNILEFSQLLTAYDSGTDDINDFINIHVSGSDTLIGVDADGGGNSFIDVVKLQGITTLGSAASLIASRQLVIAAEHILLATSDPDNITGTSGIDLILGAGGSDVIYAGGGNDFVSSGATIYGEGGDDIIRGVLADGGGGNDTITAVTAYGGTGDDSISGIGSTANTFNGNEGDDVLRGDLGADTLYGDDGNDILMPGAGNYNDTIDGGNGTDTVDYSDVTGAVTINLSTGSATSASQGTDTLTSIENVAGSAYADTITGSSGANVLSGGNGGDSVTGGAGNDVLSGQDGLDSLWGGDDADTFVFEAASAFNNVDLIKDFDTGEGDVIDISDVLDGHFNPGTDVITDFVEITTNGSNSELRVDVTGSASFGAGTLIATIEGVTGLTDEVALVAGGRLLAA